MLDQAKIIEFAIKGINAEINELKKTLNKGKQYLLQYENGEKPKTDMTTYEIHVIIRKTKSEIEKLSQFKDQLKWQLVELNDQ